MFDIHSLSVRKRDKLLLSISDLEIGSGKFTSILGPNGAGKSTLLKAISGDIPAQGKMIFHGLDLNLWSPLERARHIAVLPQASQLTFPFSANEVVALGLTPLSLSQSEARKRIKHCMQITDCIHLADKPYPLLSGGEKQRVQFARVLLQLSQANKAPLLLLDEPTSAQDLGQQHMLLDLIRELCHEKGYGVLAILHDLNLVLRYSDTCYLLSQGELKLQGQPSQCLTAESIKHYWGYEARIIHPEHPQQTAIL